jgi:hypothetical protein
MHAFTLSHRPTLLLVTDHPTVWRQRLQPLFSNPSLRCLDTRHARHTKASMSLFSIHSRTFQTILKGFHLQIRRRHGLPISRMEMGISALSSRNAGGRISSAVEMNVGNVTALERTCDCHVSLIQALTRRTSSAVLESGRGVDSNTIRMGFSTFERQSEHTLFAPPAPFNGEGKCMEYHIPNGEAKCMKKSPCTYLKPGRLQLQRQRLCMETLPGHVVCERRGDLVCRDRADCCQSGLVLDTCLWQVWL